MAWTSKKLFQGALSNSAGAKFTNTNGKTAQVCEIYLVNTGTVARTVTLYAHGTAAANTIAVLSIDAGGCVILQDLKIILTGTEVLAAKQDTGTDVIMIGLSILN